MELNTRCDPIQNKIYDFFQTGDPSIAEHLEGCNTCQQQVENLESLRKALRNLPPKTQPPQTKDDTLRARWHRLPWYFKSAIELSSLAVAILGVIILFPKIQSYYEKRVDTRLEDFKRTDWNAADLNELPEFDEEYLKDLTSAPEGLPSSSQAEGEIQELSQLPSQSETIKVGESEIWRFNILSENPRELRPQIVKIIQARVSNTESTEGHLGILVPGGIQFDLIAPMSSVPDIKADLEKLRGQSNMIDEKLTGVRQAFTWYKKKSPRKDIPKGFSRIVIWISQI